MTQDQTVRRCNGIPLAREMAAELTDKQQQFNAAMARYNARAGYALFGTAVAVANVSLQAWLLWSLWPLRIGVGGQFIALVTAWVLTDFVNGLVHMYMDNNDNYDSLAGPLIANFHLHHKRPLYEVKSLPVVYFVETGSKVWLVPCLGAVALLMQLDGINPLLLHVLVYAGVLSSLAEVSHYLCHTSTSPVAIFLGNSGLLLGKRHHAVHHLQDNVSYAFLNGFTDPLLNLIAARFSRGYKRHTDLHYAAYAGEHGQLKGREESGFIQHRVLTTGRGSRTLKTLRFLVFALSSPRLPVPAAVLKQAYYGLRENSKNECCKLLNFDDYQQCMERADRSYEEYRGDLNERQEKGE